MTPSRLLTWWVFHVIENRERHKSASPLFLQTAPEGTIFIAGNVADGVCLGSYPLDASSNYQLWVRSLERARCLRLISSAFPSCGC